MMLAVQHSDDTGHPSDTMLCDSWINVTSPEGNDVGVLMCRTIGYDEEGGGWQARHEAMLHREVTHRGSVYKAWVIRNKGTR